MRTLKLLLAGWMAITGIATTQAQTADEIVSKHIDAIGGAGNWKKITSIRKEGTFNVQGTDITLVLTQLNQKGLRQDISAAGTSGFIIITPTAGFSFLPFQGQTEVTPLPADAVKDGQEAMDVQGILLDYKTKGHAVELAGKETIDGVECFKLKITLNGGKVITDYIDSKNYYVVRHVATQHVGGQEAEQTTNFSNFQKLPEGIVIPMSLSQQFDITFSKVEVNKPVDESIFKGDK